MTGIMEMFSQNLVVRFNPWFLLYLYLTLSLVLSAAPSLQDIRNAATGTCILTAAGVLIYWSAIPWAVSILSEITRIMGMGFTLGLAFGLTALVISVPLMIVYIHNRTV
jgi:heme/copper-type cytochrome/quinol oxidase subunit 3